MSTHFKTSLLGASAIIASVAAPAHAQVVFPDADLHGAGASSIASIVPREANCISDVKPPLINVTSLISGAYTTSSFASVASNPGKAGKFDCSVNTIQKNVRIRYVSVGSGGGRAALVSATPAATLFGANTRPTSAATGSDGTGWTSLHFAFTDSPLLPSEVSTWNTNRGGASSTEKAGKLIQFPLYVLPVALAYRPVYGYKGTTPLTLNVKDPNGLRLSKQAYCGILNGNIKNWNNAFILDTNTVSVAAKGAVAGVSLADASDTARWASEGAPIRLVGRLDSSGTTDIFTRHLAAACAGPITQVVGTAKITRAAESLPFVSPATGGIDLKTVLSTTRYTTAQTSTRFAGDVSMINGAYYGGKGATDGTNGIQVVSSAPVTTEGASATAGSGFYIVANGTPQVAAAIADVTSPNTLITSALDTTVTLNGKIGYLSADGVVAFNTNVANVNDQLSTAVLEVANSYDLGKAKKWGFAAPTSANATIAFGTVAPPESDAKGKFVVGGALDPKRDNAIGWYDALYANASTLANPTLGYPMTGTTQFITGTCFASPAIRNGVATLISTLIGTNALQSDGKKYDKLLYTGVKPGKLGVRQAVGLAQLPAAWRTAITETFLKKSTDTVLAGKKLYIQNGLPGLLNVSATAKKGAILTADLLNVIAADAVGGANPDCAANGIATN